MGRTRLPDVWNPRPQEIAWESTGSRLPPHALTSPIDRRGGRRVMRTLRRMGLGVAVTLGLVGPIMAALGSGGFAKEFGIHFPLWIDPEGRSPAAFGVWGHPNTILIDRSGRVVGRVRGERDWSTPEADQLVEMLLAAGG